jgi:hypothetical protein
MKVTSYSAGSSLLSHRILLSVSLRVKEIRIYLTLQTLLGDR